MTDPVVPGRNQAPRRAVAGLVLLAALALPGPGRAGEAGAAWGGAWDEGWSGRLTVYSWLTAIDGDISARSRDAGTSISLSPSDVLDRLDFAAFAFAEVRHGPVALLLDGLYVDLSSSSTGPGPVGLRIDGGIELAMLTGALAWRAFGSEQVDLDPYAGVRWVAAEASLRARGRGPLGLDLRATGEADWVEPVVGLRATGRLTERVALVGFADIGGFGVGSDLTWQAYVGGTVALAERVDAELGFRVLSIEQKTSRLDIDTRIFGPVLGLSIGF